MIKNTAPRPTRKPQVYAYNNLNTVSYKLVGEWIGLSDLSGEELRFSPEEWKDRERVDHAVSEFYGFDGYYTEKYRFK